MFCCATSVTHLPVKIDVLIHTLRRLGDTGGIFHHPHAEVSCVNKGARTPDLALQTTWGQIYARTLCAMAEKAALAIFASIYS